MTKNGAKKLKGGFFVSDGDANGNTNSTIRLLHMAFSTL